MPMAMQIITCYKNVNRYLINLILFPQSTLFFILIAKLRFEEKSSTMSKDDCSENELSIKSLIKLLKTELTIDIQKTIHYKISSKVYVDINFEMTINKLLEEGFIKRDLSKLLSLIKTMKVYALPEKIMEYKDVFSHMEEQEFLRIFREQETR